MLTPVSVQRRKRIDRQDYLGEFHRIVFGAAKASPDLWATDAPTSVAFAFVASVVASLLSPDHSGLVAMRRDLLSRVKV